VAAFAPAVAQGRSAHAVLGAQPVVEIEQVRRQAGGDGRAAVAGLPGLLVDLRERRVAAGGDLVPPTSQVSLLRAELGAAPGDLLCLLHHLEYDLFQVTLPPFQRNDLRLQV